MTKKDTTTESDADTLRAKHFLEIERAKGDKPGAKEMAMTKRHRSTEHDGDRTRNFVEIEKGRKA